MQKLLVLPALVVLALPALADKGFTGFRCENECPLAKQANSHRSFGTEGAVVSTVLRSDVVANVEKGLARI
jgi:hypothetical protein